MRTMVLCYKKWKFLSCCVDDCNYDWLAKFEWRAMKGPDHHTFYAVTDIDGKRVYMHQLVLPCPNKNITPDHIDRNGLNNQLSNLRLATASQQGANKKLDIRSKSGYRGVTWNKRNRRWAADIKCKGVRMFLGYFDTKEEAARAYNRSAQENFGEYASLNVIIEPKKESENGQQA